MSPSCAKHFWQVGQQWWVITSERNVRARTQFPEACFSPQQCKREGEREREVDAQSADFFGSLQWNLSSQLWVSWLCAKLKVHCIAYCSAVLLHCAASKLAFAPQCRKPQCCKVGRTVAGSWLRSRLCQFLLLCAPHSHDNHPLRSKYRLIEIFVREISPPVQPPSYPPLSSQSQQMKHLQILDGIKFCSLFVHFIPNYRAGRKCSLKHIKTSTPLISGSSKQFP